MVFANVVQDVRSDDEEEEEIEGPGEKVRVANGHVDESGDLRSVNGYDEAKKKL